VVAALLVAGCGVLRPRPLDVTVTERVVLGKVDITLLQNDEILVDLAREDGAYPQQLYVGRGPHEFALALPPGRYVIGSIRLLSQRWALVDDPVRFLRVTFDVGDDPAVYVGTLRVAQGLGSRLEARVVDEYAATVAVLRGFYSNIPATIARALMKPA
jgi:hypothetical protein